ncbi:MAG: hypothetical protein NC123_18615 [Butyrivibrio sp.]|nr:hypothetical protein [Acetatifactor muris]MCM1561525.1 hypothetical protein [Butyrivibrio sp.]
MKREAGSFRFWAATVILVSVAALSFAGTVLCGADLSGAEPEGCYREKEEQLVKDTRAWLNRSGFDNSGVMLTRVVEGNGSRTYTVTIHHREIDRLEEAEREALARELAAFAFEDGSSTFYYKFLFTD